MSVDQATVEVNLASLHQSGAHTLCHDPTKEGDEHLLAPSFPRLAQDAMIGDQIVQAVAQKPHVIEPFWDDAHQFALAAHVV